MRRILSNPKGFFRKIAYFTAVLTFANLPLQEVASAGPSKCFLHGIITPRVQNHDKTTLSNMIRLKFDANERKKCEQMISAYCQYNVKDKEYSPAHLSASFKADIDRGEETEYTFTEKCTLEEK